MADFKWDQRVFDESLARALSTHKREDWPRLINKKLFFVAKKAKEYSPMVTSARIGADLLFRRITATRKDGTSSEAPLGYVLAAKRASKNWTSSAQFQKAVSREAFRGKGSEEELKAWRKAVGEEYRKMAAARVRGAGFLKVGWLSVMTELRQLAGLSFGGMGGEAGVKLVGRLKSQVMIAKPGDQIGAIGINLAKAAWDKREGQYTKGAPALQRAMDEEAASTNKHLDEEMAKTVDRFNREQH